MKQNCKDWKPRDHFVDAVYISHTHAT